MSTTRDFGRENIELMMQFNERFISGDEDISLPPDTVIMFLNDDPELRTYNINLGLKLIGEGRSVYFKSLSEPSRSSSAVLDTASR